MPDKARFIADTNVLVSRLLFRRSLPAQALDKAMAAMQIIASSETLIELGTVLSRPKFDRYLDLTQRLQFFDRLRRIAVVVSDVPPVLVCRDPKDDKFLALAVTGGAKLILSGDHDLLALHPFRTIAILNPSEFLVRRSP